ncbi:MAG TPA: MOSC domain-containing protein [Phycisphaerae bacterium]|nr:MOSC domain-containing protein [Phycisphaerae bacterium]
MQQNSDSLVPMAHGRLPEPVGAARLSGVLLTLCLGKPQSYGTSGAVNTHDKPWTTGFFKLPVNQSVQLRKTNLDGDGQADLKNHGGPDKAVLTYCAEHYPVWKNELNIDFPHGAFGENFTVSGLSEWTVCVGDVFSLGPARVEVSQPRQPCWKLARRWRMNELVAKVIENGRSGWYLRVIQEGAVEAGMTMELLDRPEPDWPVARANRVLHHCKKDRELTAALAAVAPLAQSWKDELNERLQRLGEEA